MNKKAKYHVFIGFDERETEAFDACKHSILTRTDPNEVNIIRLKHDELRSLKMFNREWKTEMDGSFTDLEDKKPFSTHFSHTRFLVPALAKHLGLSGQALFIDCDIILLGDVRDLFAEAYKQHKMIACIKHNYVPITKIKMDNREQTKYNRKLWTAVMIFDLSQSALYDKLNIEYVNKVSGRDLHTFKWLGDESLSEMEIGSIGEEWHFIPNHSEQKVPFGGIKLIHYTEGGPWFEHMRDCKYSEIWWKEYRNYVSEVLFPFLDSKVMNEH